LARPHEDREKHTLVDHRAGGPTVAFAPASWVAIGVAHVKADRNDACVAAYETLVEKARTSNVHASPAVIFASQNERRVVTVVGVQGHDGFRHLSAAWDDRHRNAQHRAISESVSFTLYKVVAHAGNADVDPASDDSYVYERVDRAVQNATDLFSSLNTSLDFRGATLLYDDVASATVIVSRFAHIAAYDTFRAGPEATKLLGVPGEPGTTSFQVHPRKTIALAKRESKLS
jgi:hypothetical protein